MDVALPHGTTRPPRVAYGVRSERRALAVLAVLALLSALAPAAATAAVQPAEPPLLHSFTFDGADATAVDGAQPLLDGAGAPLGFTLVQPHGPRPSAPATSPDQPALRAVAGGDLVLTATPGLQYRSVTTGGKGAYNLLDNALGVPLRATPGPVVVETALDAPPVTPAGGSKQAGVWLGRGQDDVVKLVHLNKGGGTAVVQLAREVAGAATLPRDEVVSATLPAGADVSLRMTVDPAAATVGGQYRLGEGAWTALPRPVPLDPALLDDPATRAVEASAGLFASRRDDVRPGPVTYSFARWSLRAASAQPPPPPPAAVAVDVSFSNATKVPPPGWLRDFGEAYGVRTGPYQGSGLTYGWVAQGTAEPLSLVGNGRDRTTGSGAVRPTDPRLGSLVHMQLPPGTAGGSSAPGSFELAVPPGAYDVEVSVGDPGSPLDSEHWLSVEDQNAVAVFTPTAARRLASARRTVWVGDGRLTLSAVNGTNTKIDYVSVRSAAFDPATTPRASGVTPQNASVGLPTLGGAVLSISGPDGGVTEASLTPVTVRLQRLPDGADVETTRFTSAGGDVVSVAPTDPGGLAPATTYRLTVDGVKDQRGAVAPPWSSVFTTGATPDGPAGTRFDEVAFTKQALPGTEGGAWTSVAFGPDGKLYASSLFGDVARWAVDADGSLGAKETITSIRRLHAGDGTTGGRSGDRRTVIGLAFGPGPGAGPGGEQVLWVSDNITYLGVRNVPEWDVPARETSGIGYLTVPADPAASVYRRVVENLPRSRGDHQTNSPVFHQGRLMIPVGANTSTGAPDSSWGRRTEKMLSAAVLALDVRALGPTQVVDAKTVEGGGTYDPRAPGAPLTLYATGLRNAYDLVSHTNGALYAPTNGSAAHGNVPASTWSDTSGSEVREEVDAAYPRAEHCVVNGTGGGPYAGPAVPLQTDLPDETDHLFTVRQGRYYGHPDPVRCEFVLNGGNPTAGKDPFEHAGYPVGTAPDLRYDLAGTYDAGMHASADGAIEYRGKAFGGALSGAVLYTRFSQTGDVVVATPDAATTNVTGPRVTGIPGLTGFTGPLDITEDTRAGAGAGNLYVASMAQNDASDSRITLLRPVTPATPPRLGAPAEAITNDVVGGGAATVPLVLTSTGGSPLTVTGGTLTGPGAGRFAIAAPTLPASIPPGGSLSVPVTFSAAAPGVSAATLTITSDDPAAPSTAVALRGLGTTGTSGTGEPSLQRVVDVLGFPVDVGDPDPATTALGSASLLGAEVPLQTMVAATDAPVGVRLLAVFGVAGTPTATAGWHAAGSIAPAARHELLAVPAASAQSVRPLPDGTATFDPGDAPFGLYGSWPPFFDRHGQGYAASTQDALNTWDAATGHHVRAYPVPGRPDAYLVAMEEHTSGSDFQDVVLLVTNVAPAPGAPGLAVTSLDGVANSATAVPAALRTAVPGPGRVVLSRLRTRDAEVGDAQRAHDAAPVRVTNTASAPAVVTSLAASDGFTVTPATALPVTLAPGAALDATVTFTRTRTDTQRNEVVTGTLTAAGEGGAGAALDLVGIYQRRSEQGDEPSLQQVLGAYGWSTRAPASSLAGTKGAYRAVGDEVLSPFWRRADAAAPVRFTQLAAYHGCCTTGTGETLSTYPRGTTTATARVRHGGLWGQSLLPAGTSGELLAQGVLSPAVDQAFGVRIAGEWSDPARNDGAKDVANGCTAPVCGHHVRFFPVRDAAGAAVPGSWVVTMDYSGINYDFQDNVYLMENARPA